MTRATRHGMFSVQQEENTVISAHRCDMGGTVHVADCPGSGKLHGEARMTGLWCPGDCKPQSILWTRKQPQDAGKHERITQLREGRRSNPGRRLQSPRLHYSAKLPPPGRDRGGREGGDEHGQEGRGADVSRVCTSLHCPDPHFSTPIAQRPRAHRTCPPQLSQALGGAAALVEAGSSQGGHSPRQCGTPCEPQAGPQLLLGDSRLLHIRPVR
ncbi:hypothetical protein TREES_T100000938 [Tupaia chinensis]|uniref:Uncharacterized protein n=1 Tax=Tupaia chinensis TaxID=246437 RepID=L9JGM6_TUPCH|nr:hypothetical protein TREES_T100000938 [Tupaia chinensis]